MHLIYQTMWLFITSSCLDSTTIALYRVDLDNSGPTVKGGNITFIATLYEDNRHLASGKFEYDWIDSAVPQHSKKSESEKPKDTWTVTYEGPEGRYMAQVSVCRYYLSICYEVGAARTVFYVNGTQSQPVKEETITTNTYY